MVVIVPPCKCKIQFPERCKQATHACWWMLFSECDQTQRAEGAVGTNPQSARGREEEGVDEAGV